jgi:serine/threonine protein kinase
LSSAFIIVYWIEPMPQNQNDSHITSLLPRDTILQSRYRIVRQLGKGGMGVVYEAIDLRLGHTVALKQTLTEDEALWKQFEHEARLLAHLNHPVLPRVSDYFTEGHRAFFVLQFIQGDDLATMIKQQPGPFPRNSVIAWADQLLDALIYLHSHDRQIIHRDIKPHNLKITSAGKIALLDFGLAKSQGVSCEDESKCPSIFGYSPRYAPLEQIQDLGTSPQSDIYALGATLYHLLTGAKPPDALTRAAALISSQPNPLKPAHEVNPAVGIDLSAILSQAMAQNPHERYQNATEFREALRRLGRVDESVIETDPYTAVTSSPTSDERDTTVVASRRPASSSRFASHAIAAVLIILLASFGVFCRYYQWKMPPTATQEVGIATPASVEIHAEVNSSTRVNQLALRSSKKKESLRVE